MHLGVAFVKSTWTLLQHAGDTVETKDCSWCLTLIFMQFSNLTETDTELSKNYIYININFQCVLMNVDTHTYTHLHQSCASNLKSLRLFFLKDEMCNHVCF